jgi:zinc/manganese transport system substrate-binding protein
MPDRTPSAPLKTSWNTTRRQWLLAACGGLAGAMQAPQVRAQTQTPSAPAPAASRPPRIVVSFSILADIVRSVAPADAQVDSLVGPDADAHVFEPSPVHGKRLAAADLVVVNGLGFEGWITRLVKVSGYKGPLVEAARGVQTLRATEADGHDHAHAHDPAHGAGGAVDPHAWQDPRQVVRYVANLGEAFIQRWPERRAEIEQRVRQQTAALQALDAALRQRLAAIAPGQRRVITSHDAFGYLGRAYQIQFLAPQGWATHSEPSAAAVARLIRQIKARQARALFVENISDRRMIDRIAQEAKVGVGGALYSDALSAPGGPADSYERLMRHNVESIARALEQAR